MKADLLNILTKRLISGESTMQAKETEMINDVKYAELDVDKRKVTAGNYEPVRFNAMTHGILSRHTVLPHEDHAEFDELLAALMNEHRPGGMTEQHLVEELASIMWRKRRVLLAEGARINEGLKAALNSPKTVMASAVPLHHRLNGENASLREFFDMSPEELAEHQQDTALILAATEKAAGILRKGGPNAYKKARQALLDESREYWDEEVEAEHYPATDEGLASFICEKLEPVYYQMRDEARFTPAIKLQTLGKSLPADQLENLNRYETHLDRKFERTLAMLLKLKYLRSDEIRDSKASI